MNTWSIERAVVGLLAGAAVTVQGLLEALWPSAVPPHDYDLDHDSWLDDFEAENEVHEPRVRPSGTRVRTRCIECGCQGFRLTDGLCDGCFEALSSAPLAGAESLHTTPCNEGPDGVEPEIPPSVIPPSGPLQDVVRRVLRRHFFWWPNASSIGSAAHCSCGERPRDLMQWERHVAPLIAEAVQPLPEPLDRYTQDRRAGGVE